METKKTKNVSYIQNVSYICQMKDEEKSCKIVGSALELFMRFGIKSLTMGDISKKLGISKKTLYTSVSDKKDLVNKRMALCLKEEEEVAAKSLNRNQNNKDASDDQARRFLRHDWAQENEPTHHANYILA